MGQSWGHTIRLLDQDERDHLDQMIEKYGPRYYTCATRNCEEPTIFKVGYLYVTGRAGRVSSSEKNACQLHGERFAKKHELELPVEPAARQTRTGYMAVTEVLRGA